MLQDEPHIVQDALPMGGGFYLVLIVALITWQNLDSSMVTFIHSPYRQFS